LQNIFENVFVLHVSTT